MPAENIVNKQKQQKAQGSDLDDDSPPDDDSEDLYDDMSPQRVPGQDRDDATNDDVFYNGDDLEYDVDDMIDD